MSEADLATHVNDYLKQKFNVEVQFDAADAIETMERLNLWEDATTLKTMSAAETVARLGEHWQKRASRQYHERMACGEQVDEAIEDVAKAAPDDEEESA